MRLTSIRQKASPIRITHPHLSSDLTKPIAKSTPQFPLSFQTQIRTIRIPKSSNKNICYGDGEIIPARQIVYTTPRDLTANTVLEMTPISSNRANVNANNSNSLEFNTTFLKKLNICSKFCDFSSKAKDIQLKEKKLEILENIANILDNPIQTKKLTQESVSALFRMISVNIFRPIPEINLMKNDIALDNEFPHLSKVYKILNISLNCTAIRPAILQSLVNSQLIKNLFIIFRTPDLREQELISEVLITISNRFVHVKKFLVPECRNFLLRSFNDEAARNALDFFFAFYGEFFQMNRPADLKRFFCQLFLAIILLDNFENFCDTYFDVVQLFFSIDGGLVDVFVNYLLRHWPVTNVGKEKIFLCFLREVFTHFYRSILPKTAILLVRKISILFNDCTDDISQMSLQIVCAGGFSHIISSNLEELSIILSGAAHEVCATHWIRETRAVAAETLAFLEKLNPGLRTLIFEKETTFYGKGERGENEINNMNDINKMNDNDEMNRMNKMIEMNEAKEESREKKWRIIAEMAESSIDPSERDENFAMTTNAMINATRTAVFVPILPALALEGRERLKAGLAHTVR